MVYRGSVQFIYSRVNSNQTALLQLRLVHQYLACQLGSITVLFRILQISERRALCFVRDFMVLCT